MGFSERVKKKKRVLSERKTADKTETRSSSRSQVVEQYSISVKLALLFKSGSNKTKSEGERSTNAKR